MPSSSCRPHLAVGCAVAILGGALGGPAWADPAPSYAALLALIDRNPVAVEADALVDAAEARARQAGVRPNPALSVDVDNALGSGPRSGFGSSETTLALSQNLELWGRRGARIEAARAEAGVAVLRRDLAFADAAGRLALVYAEAEAAGRRAALAEESLTLTLADARAALLLVEQGREPLLRAIQAESEAAGARAAFDEAVAEREAAFARLTATAMLATPVTVIPASLLDQTPGIARADVGAAPTVRVADAQKQAAGRNVEVERTLARPDVSATVGVRRYEAEDATAFVFGLSMPLPLFDRNRGNIEAAQAEFRASDARLTSARLDAEADRAAALARLTASVSRVRAADSGVTAAEEAYRLSRIGFDAGRISQLELRVTRTSLINARTSAVDARMARVRAEIDLARLDGRAPFPGAE